MYVKLLRRRTYERDKRRKKMYLKQFVNASRLGNLGFCWSGFYKKAILGK